MISIDEMKKELTTNIVSVTFTKVDGSERVMRATLDPQYLPPQVGDSTTTRKVSTTSLPVWDVDKSAWRSFKVSNVTEFVV